MNIIGIGIDFISLNRIDYLDEELINLILTKKEYDIFKKIKNNDRKIEFIAGRIVAKEALVKAFGKRFFNFSEVNILNNMYGKPIVDFDFNNRKIKKTNIFTSIAHNKEIAIAIVILTSF